MPQDFDDGIDYASMIDEAMRSVVRKTLKSVERSGLPGDHHFFISFDTSFPGVIIPEFLRAKYPEEMTIVMQHQFSHLRVAEDHFSVTLSFNNVPQPLNVPFAALTAFADPSIKFGLQFHLTDEDSEDAMLETLPFDEEEDEPAAKPKRAKSPAKAKADANKSADVISLDSFRKK